MAKRTEIQRLEKLRREILTLVQEVDILVKIVSPGGELDQLLAQCERLELERQYLQPGIDEIGYT
jgi:uncharacterized protein (UPF0335 family)